jgi:hypothetical protein
MSTAFKERLALGLRLNNGLTAITLKLRLFY